MTRHQRAWAAVILGIIAGYAALALLLDSDTPREALRSAALLIGSSGLWLSLSAARRRRRCPRQAGRR